MEIRRRIIIFTALFLIFFLAANFCLALNLKDAFNLNDGKPLNEAAIQGGGFKSEVTFNQIVGTVITTVLSLMGVIFLVLAIYGGYVWMTARGNEEMVKKAQDTIINAIIGLVIVMAAYAISYFVLEKISTKVFQDTAAQSTAVARQ